MALPDAVQPCFLGIAARQRLRRFARGLGLAPYDLLLCGDGSGCAYREAAGWACLAYDRQLKKAVVHAGAFTAGTNNLAELMPYLHALWFHDQEHKHEATRGYRVAIVSDSEVTVRCGNRQYQRRANGCLWAGIEWFERRAYTFRWRHVRRLSNFWNEFGDVLAARSRAAAAALMDCAESELARLKTRVGG